LNVAKTVAVVAVLVVILTGTALEYHLIQKGYHSMHMIIHVVARVGNACDGHGHVHGVVVAIRSAEWPWRQAVTRIESVKCVEVE
jgi:hypothetical protein